MGQQQSAPPPERRRGCCSVYSVERERPGPEPDPDPNPDPDPGAGPGPAPGQEPWGPELDLCILPPIFPARLAADCGSVVLLDCRVCLRERPVQPLPCCKKAVCQDCLSRYLGSQIHIQRTEGCDHMTCSQCNTNFCYRCGERYRQLRFFGDHASNLSIFGCKYRCLPERPHLRRLVRGSVCAGKLLITPLILVLGLALGAIAIVIGLFVFPIYCLCKKQRKRSETGMPW